MGVLASDWARTPPSLLLQLRHDGGPSRHRKALWVPGLAFSAAQNPTSLLVNPAATESDAHTGARTPAPAPSGQCDQCGAGGELYPPGRFPQQQGEDEKAHLLGSPCRPRRQPGKALVGGSTGGPPRCWSTHRARLLKRPEALCAPHLTGSREGEAGQGGQAPFNSRSGGPVPRLLLVLQYPPPLYSVIGWSCGCHAQPRMGVCTSDVCKLGGMPLKRFAGRVLSSSQRLGCRRDGRNGVATLGQETEALHGSCQSNKIGGWGPILLRPWLAYTHTQAA